MKFQKTLLAVSLAFVAITANAAAEQKKSDVYQYQKTDDKGVVTTIYTIDGKQYDLVPSVIPGDSGSFIEVLKTVDLKKEGFELLRGGQILTDINGDGKPVTTKFDSVLTAIQGPQVPNAEPSFTGYTLSTGSLTEIKAVTTTLNGVITSATGNAQEINAGFVAAGSTVLKAQQAELKNGLIAKDQIGVSNVLSETVIIDGKLESNKILSGTALTNKGLTLFGEIADNAVIDYNTGRVTTTNAIGGTTTGNQELKVFTTDKEGSAVNVISFDGKYYSVSKDNQLTAFNGKVEDLRDLGAGVATGVKDGKTETSTTQAFVGAKQSVYGEEKTSFDNANTVTVGSADPNKLVEVGQQYTVGDATKNKTSSSKDVVTGIIATDDKGNNTYGLQATNTVNGKVTAQTTVTAQGVYTTGDVVINGVSVSDSFSNLNNNVSNLNSNVSKLNKRVDDIEKASYRGIAIALATQQQIPNIGAGQFAVFGGAGHYEGESAGAIGVASVFADGRTSVSAAVGFSGGNEVGGRLGVSYVFGGK